ncbi:MAG: hydroxymethylglutaryl-CoA lyase [Rhizobiaceae bacterium]
MTDEVILYEVGPRDGLQNQTRVIDVEKKIELVNLLSAGGLTKIEVASFVSPKWVPQMADAGPVLDGITRASGVTYAALVPNERGMRAALQHGVDEIAVFTAASEAFCLNNTNCSIAESLDRFAPVIEMAKHRDIAVRGYVSTVVDCPYSGPVAPRQVLAVARQLLDIGCYQISLGDTLGNATPEQVEALLTCLLEEVPADHLAGHFHDTSGRALDNISACLAHGLRVFDASIGGLGGCPYAPGASGNVATESVVDHLLKLGYSCSVDREKLQLASLFAGQLKEPG